MNQFKNRLFRMATATVTAVCFSLTQFAVAAPVFSTSIPEVSFSPAIKLDQAIALRVPSSVATIEKLQSGSGKTIIHIQTAHGHYQAQQNINLLLKDLEINYGVKTVLLEGASESLNPEIINFFPEDHDRTMKVVDTLTRKAVLKGADIYLLESKEAKGLGIEDRAAYDRNLLDFTSVIRAREGSAQFLNQLEAGIEHVAAVYLSGDLRTFLKRIELRETGEIPFDVYLSQLKAAAQKFLDVNLTDASMQVLWPQLVRIFKIAEIEKRIDSAAFSKEKDAFLKAIQPYAGNMSGEVQRMLELKDLSAHLPNPETAQLFQSLVEKLPANFDYGRFTSVTAFCGILILKSEINAADLPVEITKLEDTVTDRLAEKNTAKELVSILKDYRLLKKLFAMELVPGDFDKIMSANSETTSPEFMPSAIVARLAKLNGDKRAKSIQFENTDKLDALYNRAIRFYEGARIRDQKMLARIEERLQSTGADKVAVITGGFHSEPFAKYFEQRGYNYALMTPKITTVDKEGRDSYLDVMMQFSKGSSRGAQSANGQPDSSTIESPDALQSQTATFSSGAVLSQALTAFVSADLAMPAVQHVTFFSANSSLTDSTTTLDLSGVSATVTGTVTRNAAVPVAVTAKRSEARKYSYNDFRSAVIKAIRSKLGGEYQSVRFELDGQAIGGEIQKVSEANLSSQTSLIVGAVIKIWKEISGRDDFEGNISADISVTALNKQVMVSVNRSEMRTDGSPLFLGRDRSNDQVWVLFKLSERAKKLVSALALAMEPLYWSGEAAGKEKLQWMVGIINRLASNKQLSAEDFEKLVALVGNNEFKQNDDDQKQLKSEIEWLRSSGRPIYELFMSLPKKTEDAVDRHLNTHKKEAGLEGWASAALELYPVIGGEPVRVDLGAGNFAKNFLKATGYENVEDMLRLINQDGRFMAFKVVARSEARGFQIMTYAQLRDKAFRDAVRPILEANQDKQFSLQFEMNGTKLGAATQGKVEYKTFASVETVQQQGLFKIWEIASGKSQDFSGNIEIALEARQQGDIIIVSASTRNFVGENRFLLEKDFIMHDQTEWGWLPNRQDGEWRHRSLNSLAGLAKHNATISLKTVGDIELVDGSFEITLAKGHEGEQGGSIVKINWSQETDLLNVDGRNYKLSAEVRPVLIYDIAMNTIEIDFGDDLPSELAGMVYQGSNDSSSIKIKFVSARSEARATQLPKGRKDKIAFGTSGHRAEDISEEEAVKFALGVLNAYQKGSFEGAVQIGFDARLHGSEYAQVVATVLAQNGLEVEITKADEIVTTPVMMERTRLEAGQKNRLAIHVTASHNPVKGKNGYWNGFKVLHNGAPSGGQSKERNQVVSWITEGANAETNKIEAVDLEQFDGFIDLGKIRWIEGANEASNARLRQTFQFDALKDALAKAGVKVVFSAMNGASAKQAPAVLNELGVLQSAHDLNPISERAGKGDAFTVKDDAGNERFFGPDPTKDYNWSADVKAAVEKMTSGATDAPDYVFMIDGDGDRLVIIDKTGKAVDPNALGMIFYHYLRSQGITTGKMVRTLPTTRGLDLLAKMFGDQTLVTAVGSKNFAESQNELVVGVEESGHVFFRYGNEEFNDSAIAEAVLALKVIADSGKTLGEYYDGVWTEVTEKTGVPRLRHHRTEVEPKKVDEALKNKVLMIRASKSFREEFATELQKRFDAEFGADTFGKWTNVDVTDSSGFAVEFEKGFAMPRNSGTEPVIREYEEFAVTLGDEGFKKAADIMQQLLLEFNTARLSAEQEELLKQVAETYTGEQAYIAKYVRMAMLYAAQASDPSFVEVDAKYVADQNHAGEGFSQTDFKGIEGNSTLAALAKKAHIQVMSLDGGLGEKLRRQEWKKWLITNVLLDRNAVNFDDKREPGLGAKGTDMGYLVRLDNGKPYYLSVSESKLINLYLQGKDNRFGSLSFQAIVNGDSIKSYEALFDKPSLIDVMNGDPTPRTYRQLLSEVGVSIDEFFFQKKVPGLRYEQGVLPMPSLKKDYESKGDPKEAYAQEAGHGQIGVATVINPEDYKARTDGKLDFIAFTNGDGQVSSNISPEIVGDMIENDRAIGNLVTPATRVDRKGGKYIVKKVRNGKVEKWLPGQRELAAAKELAKDKKSPFYDERAEQKFYDAGQPAGEGAFGKGSAGKQPFNTNTFYINRGRLMPFLAELKSVMGEDAYLAQVISPNFMKKDAKGGKDGLEYFPIDAAIGNVYHNINEFVIRMSMLAEAKAQGIPLSETQEKILAVIERHKMAEVIHYYNVPRKMFTPQKNPLDAVIQMVGGFFKFSLGTGTLDQTSKDLVPAEFDIKDAKGNAQDSGKGYYSEFLNMLNTFVDTTSIETIQNTGFNVTKLDELKIKGNLSIKETVFEGDVELINESKSEDVFDLRAAILASNELKAIVGYQEGQPLTLRNIRLTISEKGVVRAELLRVEDVVIQRGANHIRLVRETASSEATAMLNYLEARLGGESTFSRNGAAVRVALNVLREQKKIEFVFDSVGNLIAVQPRVVVGGNSAVVVIDTSVERKEFEPVNGSLAKPVSGVGYVEIREVLGIHMPFIADFSEENPTIQFAPAARSEAREVKLDIAEPAKPAEVPGTESVQVVTIKKDPHTGFELLKTFLNENMPKQSDQPLAYAELLAKSERIEVYYIPGGGGAGAGIGRVVWMAGKNTTGDTVARLQIESSDRGIDEALPLHLKYKDEALAFVQGVNLQVQLGMPQANQITLALAVRSEARYTAATNPMNIDDVKNALGRLGLDYGQDHYLISQGPDYNGFAIDLKTAAPKKASPIANELKTESALLSQYPHLRVDVVDLNRLLVSVVPGGSPSTGGTSPRSGGGQFPTTTGDKDNPRVSPDLQVPSPIELLVANREEAVESAGAVTTFTFSNEPAAQADSEETVIPAARLIEYLLKGLLSAGTSEANRLRIALIQKLNLNQPQEKWNLQPISIVVDKDNNLIAAQIPTIENASAERILDLPSLSKLGIRFAVTEPAVNIVKLEAIKARSELRQLKLVADSVKIQSVSGSGVGQRSYTIVNTTIGTLKKLLQKDEVVEWDQVLGSKAFLIPSGRQALPDETPVQVAYKENKYGLGRIIGIRILGSTPLTPVLFRGIVGEEGFYDSEFNLFAADFSGHSTVDFYPHVTWVRNREFVATLNGNELRFQPLAANSELKPQIVLSRDKDVEYAVQGAPDVSGDKLHLTFALNGNQSLVGRNNRALINQLGSDHKAIFTPEAEAWFQNAVSNQQASTVVINLASADEVSPIASLTLRDGSSVDGLTLDVSTWGLQVRSVGAGKIKIVAPATSRSEQRLSTTSSSPAVTATTLRQVQPIVQHMTENLIPLYVLRNMIVALGAQGFRDEYKALTGIELVMSDAEIIDQANAIDAMLAQGADLRALRFNDSLAVLGRPASPQVSARDDLGWTAYTPRGMVAYAQKSTMAFLSDLKIARLQSGNRASFVVPVASLEEKRALIASLMEAMQNRNVPVSERLTQAQLEQSIRFELDKDWSAFVTANKFAIAFMNLLNEQSVESMSVSGVMEFNFGARAFSKRATTYFALGYLGAGVRNTMQATRQAGSSAEAAEVVMRDLNKNAQLRWDGKRFTITDMVSMMIEVARYIGTMA